MSLRGKKKRSNLILIDRHANTRDDNQKIMSKDKEKNNLQGFEDEEVVFMLRQSPSFFSKVFFIAIGAFILVLISFYFWRASKVTSYLILISIVVTGYYFLYYFYRWSRTMYILTNGRIVSQRQAGWFAKDVNETNLDSIRFVSHSVKGISQHLMNTGNIYIRSSVAEEGGLKMKNVASPYEIQKKIVATQKKYTSKEAESMSEKEFKKEVRKRPIIR